MKDCKNCKKLQGDILRLSAKYRALEGISMRGKTIADLDRELAEGKLLDIFRAGGVFSSQGITEPTNYTGYGVKQTIDIGRAKEILENMLALNRN